MSSTFDYVIVGSGVNSLCCAALLSKKGHSVCVLERNKYFGGCIRTDEITLPGFRHDVLSGFHPLFVTSPSYAELAEDLHRHGLEYVNTHKPTAAITSTKKAIILTASRQENIDSFNKLHEGDGDRYSKTMSEMESDAEFTFSLLGSELVRVKTLWLFFKELRKRKLGGLLGFFGESMDSSRDWLTQHFKSKDIHALLAPWILHTGLAPEATFSGAMNRVIAFSLEAAGMPIVKGGSDNLVRAFVALIEENNGKLMSNAHVSQVIVEAGKAKGVELASKKEQVYANKAVICNVTPGQLYGGLIDKQWVPEAIQEEASNYKYGRAGMQIHLALDTPPQWVDRALDDVGMIHLCDGIDSVSKAVNEAERGLLPEHATIVVAQPTALDPSRAPHGKAILWIQLQELPSKILGDAAKSISIPDNGQWTNEVREAYADRIINRLAEYIPDLQSNILSRKVISPADLEAMNINLVGGDPYSGHCGMQQFFAWRPLKSLNNHETTVKDLYHIGASSHPGPGLGGNSGYMVAKLLG
ncbi:MAG: phytoene dehydrogenase-like protein [Cryomorphaceae bacterium]|jgi:phytoene dehydrogenase-like protein